jgi:Flp pilus assembly protein TadB
MSTASTEENIMSIPAVHTDSRTDSHVTAVSRGMTRPVLWLLLVISATCNVVTSVAHTYAVSVASGVITLALGTALVTHHYRTRRR